MPDIKPFQNEEESLSIDELTIENRLDRVSIGIDISPIACKIARSKTLPLSAPGVARIVTLLKNKAQELLQPRLDTHFSEPLIPSTVQNKWYTDPVRQHLGPGRA